MWTDMEQQIRSALPSDYPWKERLTYLAEVDSTNTRLKLLSRQGIPEGTVLVAGCQTGGRGRLGRSFSSPSGLGVYLSILLRPQCSAQELMHLTCAAGESMCDAVEKATGFRPGIKWTNDLVCGKKKLGGILVELGFTPQGALDYAIAGIGINCCQRESDFPPELRDKAASLEMVTGKPVDLAVLAAAMAQSLWKMNQNLLSGTQEMLCRYRKDCVTLHQEISVVRGERIRHAVALDIDEQGALVVRYTDGTAEHVNSGEVSIRGMYGYL